jgi:hypothetical protein
MQVIVELNFCEPEVRKKHHCATGAFLFCWRWIERNAAGPRLLLKRQTAVSFTNNADVSQHH